MSAPPALALDLEALYRDCHVSEALAELDRELVGLAPVKTRVREIAALLLVEKLRRSIGLQAEAPPLHMCFTGNPGTGKTTVAMKMASILHGLGYTRKDHLVAVTRDDLVGQYIGHTAPRTKEVLKRAMGGVLFIDEAYYLYRPENERDYGQEAIEILLQVMENQREDLVVILAGYKDRMDRFFECNPGTGKTTVAMRMGEILKRLGYVREGHLVTVTRDDLVGQYIGHTAPKTKEVIKKAMGGVLFIDEAYYLYKPENERDYGAESIEILLQVMENNRDDLVVILAGYKDKMDRFFLSNPGMRSRIAHHLDFPDYSADELMAIAKLMLAGQNYRFSPEGEKAFAEYIPLRMKLAHFANARSIRNALDRARLRQANRLFAGKKKNLTKLDLITLEPEDILVSRVFKEGQPDGEAG